MPGILLIRHAQASYGEADYDVLSATGRRQAAVLAEDLLRRGLVPVRIASGSLRRQHDTAAALAATTGVPIETDAGWDEYDSADVLAAHGHTDARLERSADGAEPALSSREFQVLMDEALRDWVLATDARAVEPWPAFAARVGGALERLTAGLGAGEIAMACTSGGVIAALCVALLDLAPEALVAFNRVSVNTAVTRLARGRQGTSLVSFNEFGHLDGLDPALRTSR